MSRMVTLLIALALSIATSTAFGAIIHVPADQPTIQAGINASSDGDTVLVQPDTYVENINFNGRNIALGSLFLTTGNNSYISSTIIDGNSSGSVVRFVNGENSTAVITGFTIQNGYAQYGGGIFCSNSNPTISDNTISRNSATHGGGMYLDKSTPTLTNCISSGNRADWYGGGIYCKESSPVLTDCTFQKDSSGHGGGGMYCRYSSSPTLTNCTFTENQCYAGGSGGGMYCSDTSSATIVNCLFSKNYAHSAGGLVCFNFSSPTVINCTFVANYVYGGTAGIHCGISSSPILENCVIAFNMEGVALFCYPDVQHPCNPTLTCCDVFGNEDGDWVGCIAGQAGINGNFSLDPLFCDTANNDYHISSASPCALAHNSCGVLIGALGIGCATEPIALVDPDTMYVFQAYTIDPLAATIYFGDFTDGHTVNNIDPASLNINSTITPTSWNTLPSYPGFVGEVMEITFPIRDFILGYMPLWDITVQVYTVSGEFNGKCGFSIDGEVTMFGHTSGDVNADGAVNIGDLTYLVDFLFNGGAEPPIPETADLDHNGAVNIADLTELVRVLFG